MGVPTSRTGQGWAPGASFSSSVDGRLAELLHSLFIVVLADVVDMVVVDNPELAGPVGHAVIVLLIQLKNVVRDLGYLPFACQLQIPATTTVHLAIRPVKPAVCCVPNDIVVADCRPN